MGAGVAGRFVLPAPRDPAVSRRLRWGACIGAAVIVAGSAADILATLNDVQGSADAALVRDYLANTRHGRATLLRLALAAALLPLALPGCGGSVTRQDRVATRRTPRRLGTFSWTSHAAATAGAPAVLADLVHFGAASAWAGPILYLAVHPRWAEQPSLLQTALPRVSRIGLISVFLLFVTGAYTALIHMQNPERFMASPYASALGIKLAVVFVIVGITAASRLWLLSAFLRHEGTTPLRRAVRTEAAVLVAVFFLTGVLTNTSPPHEAGVQAAVPKNLASLLRFLTGRWAGICAASWRYFR